MVMAVRFRESAKKPRAFVMGEVFKSSSDI
jgi:hypothetical protein